MKSDYISRSALAKRLTIIAMEGAKSHQRAYAKCINEVETAPNGLMWINAKWALPENGSGEVLVVASGMAGKVRLVDAIVLGEYFEDGGWVIEGYETCEDLQVSWWMELPEPPEEDE